MSCPNCLCRECAKDRAKPADGWHPDEYASSYLTYNGVEVAVVYYRAGGWSWLSIRTPGGHGPFDSMESAKQAAEAATLPAGSTPDPEQ